MTLDPLIVFTPSGKRGRFPIGTTVLNAARQLGVDLDSVCGGRGICSKCQIQPAYGEFPKHGIAVTPSALSNWNETEERYKRKRGLKEERRLGCQAIIQGNVVIDVPPESQVHQQVIRKAASTHQITMNPATKLYFVNVAPPDMKSPVGDYERLKQSLHEQWKLDKISTHLSLVSKIQTVLRKGNWQVTVAIFSDHQNTEPQIIDIWPGLHEAGLFGLAVDLGSTTIAAHLTNLNSGEVVASAGRMNPQIRFGEDLMSRVSYAMMNPNGYKEMTNVVRQALCELTEEMTEKSEIDATLIVEAVIVGNPVMHHLFLGIDPIELGQAPFALATSNSMTISALDLSLDGMNSLGQVYILPCIAGHVGADAAAVALSEKPERSDKLTLIVDVGTNAEILLGNNKRLTACSSPTGPAFEGAQISAGQRAAPGAIERVEISPETKEPRFKVIGSNLWSDNDGFHDALEEIGISGICGSGIIEAVAEMRLAGIIDKSGLIGSAEQIGNNRSIQDGRTHSYLIYESNTNDGFKIAITQSDVRAIQLAKSALYAGIKLLMDEIGAEQVDHVILTGAFGAHISTKHAMVLGMIPDADLKNVTSSGNAAGTGSLIALCDISARAQIETLVRQIVKIETAIEPKFQEYFIAANAIPHQTDLFPNLTKVISIPNRSFNVGKHGNNKNRRRRKSRSN
ncbi:MAG: ASKHA domain-containing protein [Aestuariivita sp.]|nr:ASKHA domain-containing protein [Aestuariivita sp.]